MADGGKRQVLGVLIGVLSVVGTTSVRTMIAPVVGSDLALIFYIMAVLLAAGVGGATAGILTTLLSLAVGVVVIVGIDSFATSVTELIRATVFAVEGIAISLTVEQLQRRTRRLHDASLELAYERQLVERMALEDAMTGLANRRAFERDVERFVAQSARDQAALTVVIADVDGLKRTNDSQGHKQGDALLVAVAATLRECCRASDEAYRIGGDEFALLLPGTNHKEYGSFMTRLHALLRRTSASFPGTGLSVGAAHVPDDGDSPDTLVRLADSRMYEVKASAQASFSRPTNGST